MRNTKQREEILMFLRSNRGHFTASEIYESVKVKHPDISLGTVYRNLGNLCDSGEIINIKTAEKTTYYDGTQMPHSHFICLKCEKIYDVLLDENVSVPKNIGEQGFEIEPTLTVYHGVCKNCLKKIKL